MNAIRKILRNIITSRKQIEEAKEGYWHLKKNKTTKRFYWMHEEGFIPSKYGYCSKKEALRFMFKTREGEILLLTMQDPNNLADALWI